MSGVWEGLTWDHPRGYRALEAAVRDAGESGLTLSWDRQPLEGVEAHPIADLCARAEAVLDDLQILHDRHHVPGAEI